MTKIDELGKTFFLAQGKTKLIEGLEAHPDRVIKKSTEKVTAGDGEREAEVVLKGKYSTDAIVNCFQLLEREGISTDLISRVDDTRLLCHKLDMIPIECVFRFTIGPSSSYRKRNPGLSEGNIDLEEPIIEFFYKDDVAHDPIIVRGEDGEYYFHDQKVPIGEKPLGKLPADAKGSFGGSFDEIFKILEASTLKSAAILRFGFLSLGANLEDGKEEFGIDAKGRICLGDAFDPDSCRLEYDGEHLDKQLFRDEETTPEVIERMGRIYRDFAFLSSKLAV